MNPSFQEAFWVWVRVALQSVGGPAAQVAVMHKIIVEEKKWVDEAEFLRRLQFCMLLPGPEAQQLATFLGWRFHGWLGGVVAGGLFVVPGFISLGILSIFYVMGQQASWVGALFFGIKAAVLAVVLEAVQRVSKRALKTRVDQVIALVAFVLLSFAGVAFPWIVLGAGLLGVFRPQKSQHEEVGTPSFLGTLGQVLLWGGVWLLPVLAVHVWYGPENILTVLADFFSKTAVVTFGGAYAVLSYVGTELVAQGQLSPGEVIDGLAMAEATPGPLIQVLQFFGFLIAYKSPALVGGGMSAPLAGWVASVLTTHVTFAPSFLWIFAGGPWMDRLQKSPLLQGAFSAITAAVVGSVMQLAWWSMSHVLFSSQAGALPVFSSIHPSALAIFLVACVMLFIFHARLWTVLGVGAGLGMVLSLF